MDYNARFYDPLLGRFTSPDSIIPDPGSVIGYNRYAYVANNPMIYTDPSGHALVIDDDPTGSPIIDVYNTPAHRVTLEEARQNRIKSIGLSGTCSVPMNCAKSNNLWSNTDLSFVQDPVEGQNIDPDFEEWEERQRVENAVPEGYYFDGEYETYTNWHKIDYVDLVVDVSGVIADTMFLAGIIVGVTIEVGVVFQVIEWVGLGKTIYDAAKENDIDNVSWGTIEFLGKHVLENPKTKKYVPIVGIVVSIQQIQDNFINAQDTRPVYKKIPSISY